MSERGFWAERTVLLAAVAASATGLSWLLLGSAVAYAASHGTPLAGLAVARALAHAAAAVWHALAAGHLSRMGGILWAAASGAALA